MKPAVKARSFAIAFLELVEKLGKPEKMVNDLRQFYTVYSKDKYLKSLLLSRRIPIDSKKEVMTNSFGSSLHPAVIEFIGLLSIEKSVKLLAKIVRIVDKEYKIRNNIVDVDILTSRELDDDVLDEIKEFIKQKDGRTAVINTDIDKTIIGGIKLRIGNTIVDGSVANKLNQLKNTLLSSSN